MLLGKLSAAANLRKRALCVHSSLCKFCTHQSQPRASFSRQALRSPQKFCKPNLKKLQTTPMFVHRSSQRVAGADPSRQLCTSVILFPQKIARANQAVAEILRFCTSPIPTASHARRSNKVKDLSFHTSTAPIPTEGAIFEGRLGPEPRRVKLQFNALSCYLSSCASCSACTLALTLRHDCASCSACALAYLALHVVCAIWLRAGNSAATTLHNAFGKNHKP